MDNMFLLLHNYPNVTKSGRDNEIGLLLKSTGMSILMYEYLLSDILMP